MAKAALIDPKEQGRRPLDLKPPIFDEEAVNRADDALKAMSGSFREWLDNEVTRLNTARMQAVEAGWTTESLQTLQLRSHDLKGLGATYGFPIVTQIAASLCRLIETDAGREAARAQPALVEAHVDAVRAAVRQEVKTAAHPIGRALLDALQARVDALGLPTI